MLFSPLLNVEMPTIVGILTFTSRKNSYSVELNMKKKFYNLGVRFLLMALFAYGLASSYSGTI